MERFPTVSSSKWDSGLQQGQSTDEAELKLLALSGTPSGFPACLPTV
ncbi:hypothetical protein QCJ92_00018930 [Enterobacter roggenkampii]|nr:hypothetical protein [Enterobacter roggenkampii]